jgi:haloalkane dehalogenase
MEALVRPVTLDEWPEAARQVFQAMRPPAGEAMVLDRNVFVERILPGSILRTLSDAEMDEYRRPFAEPGEGRQPTLTWPRQIPIDGEPADVVAIVADYAAWLSNSTGPKLLIVAEPGAIIRGAFSAALQAGTKAFATLNVGERRPKLIGDGRGNTLVVDLRSLVSS